MSDFIKKYCSIVGFVGGVLGVISFFLGLYDRWANPSVNIAGVVPVDVYIKKDVNSKPDGKMTFIDHGISFVVRVQSGSRAAFLGGMDIKGKVHIGFNDYTSIFFDDHPNGSSIDLWDADYTRRKPYKRISWTGWPADIEPVKLEPHQELFVRFTVTAPAPGETIPGRPAPLSNFIGFDDGSKEPIWVDDFPEPRLFFLGAMGPTFAQDVNGDIRNGNVQLFLRVGSDSVYIPPSKIQRVRRVDKIAWDKDAPADIYFGKGDSRPPGDVTPFKD